MRHVPWRTWRFSDLQDFRNLHGFVRSWIYADHQIFEPLPVGSASSIMDRAMKKIGSAFVRFKKI